MGNHHNLFIETREANFEWGYDQEQEKREMVVDVAERCFLNKKCINRLLAGKPVQ